MIRITYEQGNGYGCSCCRQTWTETEDFDTREEVLAWLVNLEASKNAPIYADEGDRCVESIEETIGNDISGEFIPDPVLIEKEIERRRRIKEKKKEEEDQKIRNREKRDLKRLAEKYPEVIKEMQ